MELAVQRLASNTSETHGLLGQRAFLRPASDGERTAQLSVTPFGRTASHAGFGPQGEGAIEGIVHDYVTEGLQDHVGGRFSRWRCGERGGRAVLRRLSGLSPVPRQHCTTFESASFRYLCVRGCVVCVLGKTVYWYGGSGAGAE